MIENDHPGLNIRRQAELLGVNRNRLEVPSRARQEDPIPNAAHRSNPYLLRDLEIDRPDQVWCIDITRSNRAGQPCRICGAEIRQQALGQRSTFWCGKCQR